MELRQIRRLSGSLLRPVEDSDRGVVHSMAEVQAELHRTTHPGKGEAVMTVESSGLVRAEVDSEEVSSRGTVIRQHTELSLCRLGLNLCPFHSLA